MNATFNKLLSMKNLRDVQKTEILVQMEQASKNKDKETLLRLTKQLRSIS
ncbi:phosphoesterase [Priestia megaterium]|nr:phosphoesterase [Priestia megaterium]MCM3196485.1 phosphoesterase [Priestia megaterium]